MDTPAYATLVRDDLATVRDEGSVMVLTGTDEYGRRVTFAGDRRPVLDVLDVLFTDDDVTVALEDWQILRVLDRTA